MKAHTSEFKNSIKDYGRELDSKITYTINGITTTLTNEELNSITPNFCANILKSVMKELDIDSNIDIPLGTVINYQFGVLVGSSYEYLDYGNYVVYSSEKQEDTNSYTIICYDKMLNSMVDYEPLNITYPITIKDYIGAICDELGLEFANTNSIFANYNKQIKNELYFDNNGNSLGYTFRNVLDELAQVTASTICINEDDKLEIRYINDTNDTIDEQYLKDVNIKLGQKYGPINSVVLSRSAESDNVYLQNEESINSNGLYEIKIIDNQIMNFNDRSDYLPDILEKVGGLEYYINDFMSTGICYYDLCDKYNIKIGENTYSCVLFNDETIITQGLQENIYTDMPEETTTDYKSSNKTDKTINQLYIIANKQEKKITALASEVKEDSEKVAKMEIEVNNISESVSSIENLIRTVESRNKISITDAVEGHLLELSIKGNISLLFPSKKLFPSKTLFGKNSNLIIENEDGTFTKIKLPIKHLWQYGKIYDEFIVDGEGVRLIQRVGKNSDGTFYALTEEIITTYEDIEINLKNGNSYIYLQSFQNSNVILSAKYCGKSDITDVLALKTDVEAGINIAKNEVEIYANQLVETETSTDELIAKVNVKPGQIKLEGTVTANGNTKITTDGDLYGRNVYFENGSFKGHIEAESGSFKGNIYLEDGNVVIGGNGMLTTKMIDANLKSQQFVGANVLLPMGFSYSGTIFKDFLEFNIEIPQDFYIISAYIILDHVPVEYYESGTYKYTGYSRNLKLYKSRNKLSSRLKMDYGYANVDYSNANFMEVENTFGANGFTGSSTSGDSVQSTDIKNYLDKGFNLFKIESANANPSDYDSCFQQSGACKATMYINGYTKFS